MCLLYRRDEDDIYASEKNMSEIKYQSTRTCDDDDAGLGVHYEI